MEKAKKYFFYKIAFVGGTICLLIWLILNFSKLVETYYWRGQLSNIIFSTNFKETKSLNEKRDFTPHFYQFKFDSLPKKANYLLELEDGSKIEGKTPFEGKIKSGKIKITLWKEGYNKLEREIFLNKNLEQLFYLDLKGQLVQRLLKIKIGGSPKSVAFSLDGKEIWVARLLDKNIGVQVINSFTGEIIKNINLKGGGGTEILFSQDGKKVYVSQMETAKVFEIDAKTKEILRVFDTKSAWTKVLALSLDGKKLFASNWSGNDISEIDLESGKTLRKIPTVKTPRGIYITKEGILYVAGFGKGEIEKINLLTNERKIIFKSGGAMRHIVGDEFRGVLYVSDMAKNKIWEISLKDDKVREFAKTDNNPNTIALSPDRKILFVSCRGRNHPSGNYYIPGPEWGSVLLFDIETGKLLDAIVGGNQPTALAVSLDGKKLVFSNFLDGELEVFEVPSYNFLKEGDGGRSKFYKKELKKF